MDQHKLKPETCTVAEAKTGYFLSLAEKSAKQLHKMENVWFLAACVTHFVLSLADDYL